MNSTVMDQGTLICASIGMEDDFVVTLKVTICSSVKMGWILILSFDQGPRGRQGPPGTAGQKGLLGAQVGLKN